MTKKLAIVLFTFLVSNLYSQVKNFYGGVGVRHNDLFSQIDDVDGNNFWVDLDVNYDYKKPFIDKEGKFDFSLRFNDANHWMWSLKEAQLTHLWKNSELSYGRVLLNWVEIDKVWGLGKVNNLQNFDFFRPGQEGLAGIKYKYRFSQQFEAEVFGSMVYVPQLNPALAIDRKNGTITSKSPWSQPPASEVSSGGTTYDIKYTVSIPSLSDVAFKPSIGFNLKYTPVKDIHFTGYVLRKPENSLSNTVKAKLSSSSDVDVEVNTQLFDHTVFGGQLRADFGDHWKGYISYLTSIPETKPEDLTSITFNFGFGITTEKYQEDYVGAGIRYNAEDFNAHLGYLARISDFERKSLLDTIPRWSQAINLNFDYNFMSKYFAQFDLKYDTLTFDRLYSLSLGWQPLKNFRVNVGADIIGTPQFGDGFWVNYRRNDSYFTELKYVF